jgi:integrase
MRIIWRTDGAITPVKISECRGQLLKGVTQRGTHRAPATVVRYLAALSNVLTTAANEWGWLEDSPMRKVTKPKEPRGRVRFLSEDTTAPHGETIEGERNRLLKAGQASTNPYLYPVVVLALSTGMRQGEIMGLTWDDVDLHRKRITLHETKNGERRIVECGSVILI